MQASTQHECVGVSRCTLQATEEQKFGMPYFGFCAARGCQWCSRAFLLNRVYTALSYLHMAGEEINEGAATVHVPCVLVLPSSEADFNTGVNNISRHPFLGETGRYVPPPSCAERM